MGPYLPSVDEQFEEASPYSDAFGTNSATLIGLIWITRCSRVWAASPSEAASATER